MPQEGSWNSWKETGSTQRKPKKRCPTDTATDFLHLGAHYCQSQPVAEAVLPDQLPPVGSRANYVNCLNTGVLLVATPLPFSSSFFPHLYGTRSFHSLNTFTCQLSSSWGAQRSGMGDQKSRHFYLKSISKGFLKWDNKGRNKFEPKAGLSNSKHSVRKTMVNDVTSFGWLQSATARPLLVGPEVKTQDPFLSCSSPALLCKKGGVNLPQQWTELGTYVFLERYSSAGLCFSFLGLGPCVCQHLHNLKRLSP